MGVTVNLCPLPKLQFSQNGVPVAGGKLFTYEAGTSTKLATYADPAGTATNNNPIILDANGQCDCYLQGGLSYKLVLAPSTDVDPPQNPYWTEDQITGINQVLSTYGADVGVANAYAVNLDPALTSYADGQEVVFDAANTNTGASTLNVNGLGPKQILIAGAATLPGAVKATQRYLMSYSASLGAFVQLGTSLSALVGSSLNVSGSTTLSSLNVSESTTLSGPTTITSLTSGASGSAQPPQMQQTLGEGASAYTNQTTARALATTYTNNTTRVLVAVIAITGALVAGSSAEWAGYVGGAIGSYFSSNNQTSGTLVMSFTLLLLVPPGATYSAAFTPTNGSVTQMTWYEY